MKESKCLWSEDIVKKKMQSLASVDRVMAEGIRKSFKTDIIDKIYESAVLNGSDFDKDDFINYMKENIDYNKLYYSKYIMSRFNKTYDSIIDVLAKYNDIKNTDIFLDKDLFKKIYKLACYSVEEETEQAMEALIHNLNTLHSRSGAQVPFSSLNYGLDTSPEGRLATEKLLKTTWDGLGKGETPIFPIQIFTIKKGINYDPGDINYDLFKLACKVSAKRLFPGFTNQDASYNLPYYKEDDYRTHITAMGCADGKEIVTYKYNNVLYCESLSNLWDRVHDEIKEYGISHYKSPENMFVWDGENFVEVLTVLENPDCGDWVKVTFSNDRELLLTENHPLYTENKGRCFVSDLEYGDTIKLYNNNPINGNEEPFSTNEAYLLGVMVAIGRFGSSFSIKLETKNNLGVKSKIIELLKSVWNIDGYVAQTDYNITKRPYEIIKTNNQTNKNVYLQQIFTSDLISVRNIPNTLFTANREIKLAFIAGIVDSNFYITYTNTAHIGCVSKSLALQIVGILKSIGVDAKLLMNYVSEKYPNGIKFCIEFDYPRDIYEYLGNEDRDNIEFKKSNNDPYEIVTVTKTTFVGICHKASYDLETTSDRFALSFFNSGNCRTRVIGNVNGPEICTSRGNFAFVTLNLVKMGIEANKDINKFFELLDKYITLSHDYLQFRYNIIKDKHVYNYPFLMEQGIWLDSEKLKLTDTIEKVLKHCSLSIGFCGLAECLVSLIGKHHGESAEAQNLGLKIISHIRERTDEYTKKEHMNWTCFASPAESTAGSLQAYNRKKYGIIKGVTDRIYMTNSAHVPVYYKINIIDKIRIEAPYHRLCNAGNIGYIEFDGDPLDNLEAFESIIRAMHDNDMGYFNINHPVDRDPVCGYTGIIKNECPHCKRKEQYSGCIEIPRMK